MKTPFASFEMTKVSFSVLIGEDFWSTGASSDGSTLASSTTTGRFGALMKRRLFSHKFKRSRAKTSSVFTPPSDRDRRHLRVNKQCNNQLRKGCVKIEMAGDVKQSGEETTHSFFAEQQNIILPVEFPSDGDNSLIEAFRACHLRRLQHHVVTVIRTDARLEHIQRRR